jgi:hypothetical protein
MIKLNQRQTGYAGMWLRPIEGSVADELELADPFFTNLDRVHFYLFRSANSKPTE